MRYHIVQRAVVVLYSQGRIQDFGKGGPINIFTTGGGYVRGRAPL